MAHLDVYVERRSIFLSLSADYILAHVLQGLSRANLTYRILEQFESAISQCAFVHVDLTELPKHFWHVDEYYPRCVNGRATTISRLLYSSALVLKNDDYDGPVIVKTVLNHRGLPELRFESRRSTFRKILYALKRRAIRDYDAKVCPVYRVYTSISKVPAAVWSDRRLIVERFLPGWSWPGPMETAFKRKPPVGPTFGLRRAHWRRVCTAMCQ